MLIFKNKNKNNFDEKKVKNLFEEQIEFYSSEKTFAHCSLTTYFIEKWLSEKINEQQNINSPLKICEFGGAGGILLDKIDKLFSNKVSLYNAELVDFYSNYQTNKNINFVNTSILNSEFQNNSFDIIIIRNVLHHLIGKSYKKTYLNQYKAISELFRLVRDEGIIIIEELVNQSLLASKIIFYLSKFTSLLRLRIQRFQITPYTIVFF